MRLISDYGGRGLVFRAAQQPEYISVSYLSLICTDEPFMAGISFLFGSNKQK